MWNGIISCGASQFSICILGLAKATARKKKEKKQKNMRSTIFFSFFPAFLPAFVFRGKDLLFRCISPSCTVYASLLFCLVFQREEKGK